MLYLKKTVQNNLPIYESDKKFLKIIRTKVNEKTKRYRIAPNKFRLDTEGKKKNLKQISSNLIQNTSVQNSEKILFAMMQEMHELKKRQLRMTEQLQLINTQLLSPRNKTHDQYKLKNEKKDYNPKKYSSFLERYSKIMIWGAAGLSVVWYAGIMNVINIGFLKDVSLGISIGLTAGIVFFYKVRKKLSK